VIWDLEFHPHSFGFAIGVTAVTCDECDLIHGFALGIGFAVWTVTIGWQSEKQ
jgi:hypothetical protein